MFGVEFELIDPKRLSLLFFSSITITGRSDELKLVIVVTMVLLELEDVDDADKFEDENGRRFLADLGKSNRPPLLFCAEFIDGVIVLQHAMLVSSLFQQLIYIYI